MVFMAEILQYCTYAVSYNSYSELAAAALKSSFPFRAQQVNGWHAVILLSCILSVVKLELGFMCDTYIFFFYLKYNSPNLASLVNCVSNDFEQEPKLYVTYFVINTFFLLCRYIFYTFILMILCCKHLKKKKNQTK